MRAPRLFIGLLLYSLVPAQTARLEFRSLKPALIEERLGRFATRNAERAETLEAIFREAGCERDRLRTQAVKGTRVPNVICALPGETESTIVVGAHLDCRCETGKGVVDNWSGAALLPSLFQSLGGRQLRHTMVFVGFSAEEEGLIGSRLYVKNLSPAERTPIRAMVNLDSLGLSPTKVAVSESDRKLVGLLARVAEAMKLPVTGVHVHQVGTDDARAFAEKRIPAISIHSLTQETLPVLHSLRDNPKAIQFDDYYQTYRLMAAYLVFLDTALE